jgi:hypothetical protein
LKVRIDGEQRRVNVDVKKLTGARELLRLIELRFLYPNRVIKHVEVDGKVIPPEEVISPVLLRRANIVTESSVDFVKKHIEFSIFTLDAVRSAVEKITSEWYEKEDVARLHLESLLNSIDWTVKVFERGAKLLPIIDSSDEAVLKIEESLLKADELLEVDEEELLEFLNKDFLESVSRWKRFLREVLRVISKSSMETH